MDVELRLQGIYHMFGPKRGFRFGTEHYALTVFWNMREIVYPPKKDHEYADLSKAHQELRWGFGVRVGSFYKYIVLRRKRVQPEPVFDITEGTMWTPQ